MVFEDHDWGARIHDSLVDESPYLLNSIADMYMMRSPSSKKSFISQRVEYLEDAIENVRPDCVIFFNRQYDDPASWDYPEQANMLKKHGVPYKHYSNITYDLSDAHELKASLSEFIKTLE